MCNPHFGRTLFSHLLAISKLGNFVRPVVCMCVPGEKKLVDLYQGAVIKKMAE